jgi:hypothetical protein
MSGEKRVSGGARLTSTQRRELEYAQECDRRAAAMAAPEVANADEIATLAILALRWDAKLARAFLKGSREAAEAIIANPPSLTRKQRQDIAWLLNLGKGDDVDSVRRRAIGARLLATLPRR